MEIQTKHLTVFARSELSYLTIFMQRFGGPRTAAAAAATRRAGTELVRHHPRSPGGRQRAQGGPPDAPLEAKTFKLSW